MATNKDGKSVIASMEEIVLKNDVGADFVFQGRLYSESSFFDEETGVMTRQRLYVTDQNQQVYSIFTSNGSNKDMRTYMLQVEGEMCRINNGLFDVTIPLNLLMVAVRGLCGLGEQSQGCEFLDTLEENLRVANQ